ncbi:hypothetical protein KY285_017898 [Solanum tuberosum]|nr:hypothetical protein KY284_017892 [Solanum tuberosum]KAH0690695.1 hypothetical protein KY289_018053 [Solanum tuberosum]KAH0703620.1 hypothetical protein KY285_017898 [Solanum tuberosum]
MRALASVINHPWAVTSDFNSILSREEKLGGIPHTLGSDFTWCNERSGKDIIWKRLDRMSGKLDFSIRWQYFLGGSSENEDD